MTRMSGAARPWPCSSCVPLACTFLTEVRISAPPKGGGARRRTGGGRKTVDGPAA